MKKFTCLCFAIIMVFGSFAIAQNSTIKTTESQTQTETVQVKKQMSKDLNFEKVSLKKSLPLERANNTNTINTKSTNTISNIVPDTINNRQTAIIKDKPVVLKGDKLTYKPNTNQPKSGGAIVAPINDDICSAYTLPLKGVSLNNQTNYGSTADYAGGCIPIGVTTVFYSFTLTGSNDMITITLSDFIEFNKQLNIMLLSGSCDTPNAITTQSTTSPSNEAGIIEHSFYGLNSGITYYIMIASLPETENQFTNYTISGQQRSTPTRITGDEQDCFGAVSVCDNTYSQTNSYTGVGSSDELNNGATCLYSGETNSVWYVFSPQTSGSFFFEIVTLNDYDWALYDLTDIGGCDYISSADPVLCNYSGTYGNTGTNNTVDNNIPRSIGAGGSPYMPGIDVTAENTYALLVNNYTADANGYSLSFSGTASITDNPDGTPSTGAYPSMSSASVSCTANTINVPMSELIDCSSISSAGFTLTNTTTSADFTSAMTTFNGQNCASSELTSTLIIGHNGSLTTGQYELKVNTASTIYDKCGNLLQIGGTVSFNYLAPLSLTASKTNICSGESINLNAEGADNCSVTYTLVPGGATNNTNGEFNGLTPAITSTYTVSATYGGCTRTATETVNVEGNIIVNVDPAAKTVCDFTSPVVLTASTSINGTPCVGCIHTWSTTETTDIININAAGTYTVTAVTASGCASSNTASSTITLASSGTGGGSCDVIYVSPSGSGDGYTKEAPTSLADAVAKARCTNTDIKMMVGVYTLTNFQVVPSYITIDGGYNSDFTTKSSDMSGGTNSTTIRRTSSADTGFAGECSAFRVENAAEDFRIQNLRIEMPGSTNVPGHTAASGLVSYGIKLGTGCTNYNIVRCYIDAGVGAAP